MFVLPVLGASRTVRLHIQKQRGIGAVFSQPIRKFTILIRGPSHPKAGAV